MFERGIQDEESLKKFLEPSLETYDPYLLHDMDTERDSAIEEGERLPYGDYDADGMTSAARLCWKSLELSLVLSAVFTSPNRFYRWLYPMPVPINTYRARGYFLDCDSGQWGQKHEAI